MRHRAVICSILALTLVLLASAAWAQDVLYKVIPITSPFNQPGTNLSNDINKGGVIALTDYRNGQQAFEWKSGKSIPLTLLGGACSTAIGISSAGHIVGGACPAGETAMHAYIYRKDGTVDLGTFGGVAASGTQVNRYDQIAGDYTLTDGTARAFFWKRSGWTDLGGLGGSFTFAYGMNRSAIISGQSDVSNTPDPVYGIPPFHGFVWSAGTITDLGSVFGSNFNYVFGINDAGVAAGSADLVGDTGAHAIVWNDGTVQDLSPDGNISAGAVGINNLGQVVGSWGSVDPDPADGPPVDVVLCPCYAVLWQNGQEIFLNDTVPAGWSLLLALAINDRGEIVARGQFNSGPLETVLLKPLPVPEQSTERDAPRTERRVVYAGPRTLRRDRKGGFQEIW
jgi:probable HAF family extracellular repeat protein